MTSPNLTLLTDLYQLTMSYGYWKQGMQDREAVFHLFFRRHPFGGGYTLAAGLEAAVRLLADFQITASDCAYLRTLTGRNGQPLFEPDFLAYLQTLRMTCEVDAVPEGTVVFPHEPLLRIRGPVILGQLLETPLLNLLNFNTLIATKAARIVQAAGGDAVLEFGLRRAQGPDGGMSASRAAYLAGCAATSNVLAGKQYGIPVRGTHAHSWVMSFEEESAAFDAYAEAMPHNTVLLVDTYDTLEGVRQAIRTGYKLRVQGHTLSGIRLDSGDLATLSIEARALLDAAGFEETAIVASNDLDEYEIETLRQRGARINVWGVGTRLVTAYDQPALGGVYKLAAMRAPGQPWSPAIKLSENPVKVSNPGIQQVRRYQDGTRWVADVIYSEETGAPGTDFVTFEGEVVPLDGYTWTDMLVPIFREGQQVYELPTLETIRARAAAQLAGLPAGCLRLHAPDTYPSGLSRTLTAHKHALISARRPGALQ
ncbi:MAG: nicotinate phosphoribosyltransferase [Bacteroidia bacterium]|nr:nicotinate phosphoribosyltransferase [Bacteroidia bacterium]